MEVILVTSLLSLEIQWNLSWETTAMRDHLSWKTISFWQKVLHVSVNAPVTKDHLSSEPSFWPMGWSFKTVLLYNLLICPPCQLNPIWYLSKYHLSEIAARIWTALSASRSAVSFSTTSARWLRGPSLFSWWKSHATSSCTYRPSKQDWSAVFHNSVMLFRLYGLLYISLIILSLTKICAGVPVLPAQHGWEYRYTDGSVLSVSSSTWLWFFPQGDSRKIISVYKIVLCLHGLSFHT